MRVSVACLATLAFPVLLSAQSLTPHQQLARDIYKELIEINTSDSVGRDDGRGGDGEAISRRGISGVGHLPGRSAPGQRQPRRPIPRHAERASRSSSSRTSTSSRRARPNGRRDPFTMVEQNGYFLGRGTADDKAMAAIFVANVLQYKKEGWRPERDLVLALTADEEGGDANGVQYLLAEHRPLIDAAYALNEGGGGTLNGMGPRRASRSFTRSKRPRRSIRTSR